MRRMSTPVARLIKDICNRALAAAYSAWKIAPARETLNQKRPNAPANP